MGGKIYFALLLLLHAALFFPDLLERVQSPLHLLDLGITAVTLAGVFGYAFEKRIGPPRFWKVWLFVQAPWDLYMNFPVGYIFPPHAVMLILLILFLIPEYLMIYRYGFRPRSAA